MALRVSLAELGGDRLGEDMALEEVGCRGADRGPPGPACAATKTTGCSWQMQSANT